ncbi:hypothetical protein ABTK64_19775, partial [Acinetobacter baumannii]
RRCTDLPGAGASGHPAVAIHHAAGQRGRQVCGVQPAAASCNEWWAGTGLHWAQAWTGQDLARSADAVADAGISGIGVVLGRCALDVHRAPIVRIA